VIGTNSDNNETGFDLLLERGEIAVLQAPNGWGKSTLMDSLAGTVGISSGSIGYEGDRIEDWPDWKRSRAGIRLNAAGAPYFRNLSLTDVQALSQINSHQTLQALDASTRVSSLSGGQLRRFSLDNFLSQEPLNVALLDEPLNALDEKTATLVIQRLKNANIKCALISEPSAQ
jgi:ABC-type multidrug transport system ATPase subunit